MGLFSRKEKSPDAVRGDDYYETDEAVLLGSSGDDMDAETDVVGESQFRDTLLMLINIAEEEGQDVSTGRMEVAFQLDAQGPRIAVALGDFKFGYVEDEAAAEWHPRVREWQARGKKVMCSGVVLWNPRLGDPRESENVPVGVRLDLVDQR